MIKLLPLLENNIDLAMGAIEQPSFDKNELNAINDYANQVAEYFPDGVAAYDVLTNIPDEISYSTKLKVLITLAKHKLLNLGDTEYKVSPKEVLAIYGKDSKEIADKADFNMNEIKVHPNLDYDKLFQICWQEAIDEMGEYEWEDDENELSNEEEVSYRARELFHKKFGFDYDDWDLKTGSSNLEEGWKENILSAIITASSMVGGVKAQDQVEPNMNIQNSIEKSLTIPMGALFQSGKYIFKDADQKNIATKLQQIGEYVSKNPNSDFEIEIISSESQVPNYDAEVGGRVKLKVGELAQKRAQTAEFTIVNFMKNLRKEGILKGKLTIIQPPTIRIGSTPYKVGDNINDSKFTKDQYVNIIISTTKSNTVAFPANYKVISKDEQRLFNNSKHAIADVDLVIRKSDNIKNNGNIKPTDILIRWLNNSGNETGEKSLVPIGWWNTNIKGSELGDDIIKSIKSFKL